MPQERTIKTKHILAVTGILTVAVAAALLLANGSSQTSAAPVVPVFADVSAAAGLKVTNDNSFGLQWGDYDNDGFPDLYVGRHGGCDPDLFHNNGNGTFQDVSAISGVRTCGVDRHNCVWADVNRDLKLDLFCTANEVDNMLINQGGGTFVDQGEAYGLGADYGRSANLVDYDNDGRLDILFGGVINLLLFHGEDTRFEQVANLAPMGNEGPRSSSIADYDMDGYEDAFVAQFPDSTWLLLKGSPTGFTDATAAAGLSSLTGADAGVWGDYDNDGDPDLFVTEWRTYCCARNFRLMENQGNGTFTNATVSAGLTQSAGHTGLWGDFNNDGLLDLFVVNGMKNANGINLPDQLYLNNGNKTFSEFAASAGLQGPSQGSGDSAAWADYDRDGDLDIVVGNGSGNLSCRPDTIPPCFGPDKLYRNQGNSNKSFQARLMSNHDTYGYGAKIWATTAAGTQYREMTDGIVGKSQNAQVIHFGLGSATQVDTLRVAWSDGTEETFSNLPANTGAITIQQGTGVVGEPTPQATASAPTPTPTAPPALPDYVVTTIKKPPATIARGGTFPSADTTKNFGVVAAPVPSTTVYFLSTNRLFFSGVLPLTNGQRTVAALAPGAQSWGTVSLTVPTSVPPGRYYLLACANATFAFVESGSFLFNCASSTATVLVQ